MALTVLYIAMAGIRWLDVDVHDAGAYRDCSWDDALCGLAAIWSGFTGKGPDAIVGESGV